MAAASARYSGPPRAQRLDRSSVSSPSSFPDPPASAAAPAAAGAAARRSMHSCVSGVCITTIEENQVPREGEPTPSHGFDGPSSTSAVETGGRILPHQDDEDDQVPSNGCTAVVTRRQLSAVSCRTKTHIPSPAQALQPRPNELSTELTTRRLLGPLRCELCSSARLPGRGPPASANAGLQPRVIGWARQLGFWCARPPLHGSAGAGNRTRTSAIAPTDRGAD